MVEIDLGRCFFLRYDMSPDQVAKKTLSMALIHLEGTEEKDALWRKVTRLALVA